MKYFKTLVLSILVYSAYPMQASDQDREQNRQDLLALTNGIHHGAYTIDDPRLSPEKTFTNKFGGTITKKSVSSFIRLNILNKLQAMPKKPTQIDIDALYNAVKDLEQALQKLYPAQ